MRFTGISPKTAGGSAPATPLQMLLACHAHIRHFVQLSRTLAGAEGAPGSEIAEAAEAIHRYFSQALPLHEADENQTVFERLQGALPRGHVILEAAETMIEQHAAIDELAAELLSLCTTLSRHPEALPSVARRLNETSTALESIFNAHLKLEETVIFPALEELTTAAQKEEMAREMTGRRGTPRIGLHLVR